jgi:hypothetical protein
MINRLTYLFLFGLLLVITACSTEKNTLVSRSYHGMTDRLLSRKRETSDLNVLCRVCNAFDHLRRRDPEAAKMYDIRYAKFINQEDQWQEITKVVEN